MSSAKTKIATLCRGKWDHDLDVRGADLTEQLVHRPSIVGPIGYETSDRRVDLFEQTPDSGRVVLAALRELRRHDEAVVIHADMQLPSLSTRLRALVPVGVPLTGTRE